LEMITRLQGGGGCPKWPQKGLRNICIAPNNTTRQKNSVLVLQLPK
jgi:hypothetical protein